MIRTASSCSAHVTMERNVNETCSDYVIYDVKYYPYAGTDYIQVVSKTQVDLDSSNNATLTFSSEFASLPSNHPIRQLRNAIQRQCLFQLAFDREETKDYHRILWTVEDGCGNLSTCEYLFRLEDCKQPSPVCVGLSSVVMPTSGEVTIWAKTSMRAALMIAHLRMSCCSASQVMCTSQAVHSIAQRLRPTEARASSSRSGLVTGVTIKIATDSFSHWVLSGASATKTSVRRLS